MTQALAPMPQPAGRFPRRPLPHRLATIAAALACTLAAALVSQNAAAAPLDELRRQVEASQFEQAYQTAQTNAQLIGDAHFDFLYGVAAINVGRVAEGLMALERHLAVVPANDRARLELARGYFLLGEYTRARNEFEFVLRYNPPAGVRASIAGYMQAMQVREAASGGSSTRLYAEAGLGHDTNVNGGTFHDEVQLVFGKVTLTGLSSQQVADSFSQLAVGGQQQVRVSSRMSVFAGADLEHRGNSKERAYDISSGGLYIGFTRLASSALWRVTLGSSEMLVGHRRYRDTLSLGTEASVTLSPELGVVAFMQYGEMRHAVADESRDARATTLGANFTRNFPDVALAPQLGVRLSWTKEDSLRQRQDLSREMPLLRLSLALQPEPNLRLALGLTTYRQNYGGEDIGFGTVRQDTSVGADLVATYAMDARWTLRGEAQWSRNTSNQDLYDSSRKAASLKLRYQY